MQAGRLVAKALTHEAGTGECGLAAELVGHTPGNRSLAERIMGAIERRQHREVASTCAAIAPRDTKGRFA